MTIKEYEMMDLTVNQLPILHCSCSHIWVKFTTGYN